MGSDGVEEESGLGFADADAEKKRRPGWRRTKRSRPWGNAFGRCPAAVAVGLRRRRERCASAIGA